MLVDKELADSVTLTLIQSHSSATAYTDTRGVDRIVYEIAQWGRRG